MIFRIMTILIRISERLSPTEGDLLWPGDKDNTRATRYIDRVTNKANLEASNELFIHLVEEAHKRGMK